MTQQELDAIIAGVTAKLAAPAAAVTPTLPAWVAEAQATAKTSTKKTKAPKPASLQPHRVATRASFESGGKTYTGFRVVKMFGATPDKRRPDGKFILDAEVEAILAVAHTTQS